MSKKDPLDALTEHYDVLQAERPSARFASRKVTGETLLQGLLMDLAPLGAGAIVAVLVVVLFSRLGTGTPDLWPMMQSQIKASGLAIEDVMPPKESKPKKEAGRQVWIV